MSRIFQNMSIDRLAFPVFSFWSQCLREPLAFRSAALLACTGCSEHTQQTFWWPVAPVVRSLCLNFSEKLELLLKNKHSLCKRVKQKALAALRALEKRKKKTHFPHIFCSLEKTVFMNCEKAWTRRVSTNFFLHWINVDAGFMIKNTFIVNKFREKNSEFAWGLSQ